jgi:outer membrane protein OmpA-like peptidoglycan-associated protein
MEGQVVRQTSSYRHGLVLGLTMAEVMILMVFCLLIAMAAFLKMKAEPRRPDGGELSQGDLDMVVAIKRNSVFYERVRAATSGNPAAADEFWRDLVEDQEVAKALQSKGIDPAAAARDADIVGSISKRIPDAFQSTNPTQTIMDVLERGLRGHEWPPIISLSEANGHYFKTGSAELEKDFRDELMTSTPKLIAKNIKEFDVDVIEVVGHTDEQPITRRSSNLDRNLIYVLTGRAGIEDLIPADNAGLGLARALSVVTVLRESPLLRAYKLIPLSGAQLVNTDETLAISGISVDMKERRRIEIRLRKSTSHDASITTAPIPAPPRKPSPSRPTSPATPAVRSPGPPFPATQPR